MLGCACTVNILQEVAEDTKQAVPTPNLCLCQALHFAAHSKHIPVLCMLFQILPVQLDLVHLPLSALFVLGRHVI